MLFSFIWLSKVFIVLLISIAKSDNFHFLTRSPFLCLNLQDLAIVANKSLFPFQVGVLLALCCPAEGGYLSNNLSTTNFHVSLRYRFQTTFAFILKIT